MQFPMNNIFNASEEIADSAQFDHIRFYKIDSNMASTPQENLLKDSWKEWSNPTEAAQLGRFSAVCFLTARYINEVYGKKVSL